MIPEREPDRAALSVASAEGMLIEFPVFLGSPPQQIDLLAFREHETVLFVLPHLILVKRTFSHCGLPSSWR
jgi:hypothetical protein